MSANTRFAIAVHILAVLGFLEKHGVARASSEQIAKSVNANPVMIRTMLRELKRARLIISKEGKGGGVRLARPSAQISLQDIFAAVREKSVLAIRDKPAFKPCPVSRGMREAFTEVATEVDSAIAQVLGRKTLLELVQRLDS